MTPKQKIQFNYMRKCLLSIAKGHMTPEQLHKDCNSKNGQHSGMDYNECLQMSYENMQYFASHAVKGVKEIK